tara:strand:+ start:712 stop:1299 length:588 start_codon:yes stop_codon:yes gene_type:complete
MQTSKDLKTIIIGGLVFIVLGAALLAAGQAQAADSPDYRISPEDVLDVSVWREPDLQRQVTVRPDGGVSLPLIGDVAVAGSTVSEAEAKIRARLMDYIPEAVVTVSVVQLRGLRIYVTGQVKNPGQFEVGRYIDVLQAITLAGGFTPFAKQRNVQIIRRDGAQETVYKFNYKELQRGRNLAQNIQLKADDVVLVP